MHESSSEKYLGDIFNKSGTNKENLSKRIAKGFNRVRTILAMVQEMPLGWAKLKAGLRLRKPLLINAILFNSESWHGVSQEDIEDLKQVDQALLRGLVDGHAKVALPGLYLELGQEPLRFVLAARRVLYLHTLLNRDDKELTKKIYLAQKDDPSKGDFCLLVENNLKMLEIRKSNSEIKEMKKRTIENASEKTSQREFTQVSSERSQEEETVKDDQYEIC